ncbi:MAG: oxidoreductase [Flavobacterium sp.]
MKRIVFMLLIVNALTSCTANKNLVVNSQFSKITLDTLLNEKISCRALSIDGNKVWFAANNGKYGYAVLDSKKNFIGEIAKENLKLEFRSIAQTSKYIFILSVANPGLLYRIAKDSGDSKLVYEERSEKVFYDSMQFFNDLEGIAIGDPTEECPSIIKTHDGGVTWQKLPCTTLPKFTDGEAFFAASNTNLIVRNNEVWMVSGGKKSKVYHSKDKGNTWTAFETPILQGQAMTGAFCADFYDEKIGVIAGGNYEKPDQNFQNKALTTDGGKTWKLIAENQGFGYASCVQFFPNSGGKSIISVGASGVYYTRNSGETWEQLAPDKDFLTIRFIDDKTAVAAGKNRIVRINFK